MSGTAGSKGMCHCFLVVCRSYAVLISILCDLFLFSPLSKRFLGHFTPDVLYPNFTSECKGSNLLS